MSERTEIIDGERYASPAPTAAHENVVRSLRSLLEPWVRDNGLGEMMAAPAEVRFEGGDVVQPDLAFVRREREVEGVPDLIVEVVSSSTATLDYQLKRDRYAHFRVPEYWIVDPQRRELAIWTPANRLRPRLCVQAGETFTWQPQPEGPALTIRLSDLLQDVD